MMKRILIALVLIIFIQSDADLYDPERIYNAIIDLKIKYPTGYPWTEENQYVWGPQIAKGLGLSKYTGYGCCAFAMLASDAAFGDIPVYKFFDRSKIRVGDILRIHNDTHFVIVLKIGENSHYTVAEGNIMSMVYYGRVIDLEETGFTFGFTRYKE